MALWGSGSSNPLGSITIFCIINNLRSVTGKSQHPIRNKFARVTRIKRVTRLLDRERAGGILRRIHEGNFMNNAARFVGRFFALALLLVLIGIQNGQCQQAVDLVFTNKFASFTNLQGETFIGAELIEADATQVVFKTNDIYGAVKFTNLSTATLKSLGIPLSRLGLAHELEVQKAKAIANQRDILSQEQEELSDPSKLSGLRINSVISKSYSPIYYGWLQWCNVIAKQRGGRNLFLSPNFLRLFRNIWSSEKPCPKTYRN